MSYALVHLGIVPLGRGDHERGREYFEEALAISREDRRQASGYIVALQPGAGLARSGDHERAAELYVEGLDTRRGGWATGRTPRTAWRGWPTLIAAERPSRSARRGCSARQRRCSKPSERPSTPTPRTAPSTTARWRQLRSRLGEDGVSKRPGPKEGRCPPKQAIEYALKLPQPSRGADATPDDYPAGLSAREVEVLRLVARA